MKDRKQEMKELKGCPLKTVYVKSEKVPTNNTVGLACNQWSKLTVQGDFLPPIETI